MVVRNSRLLNYEIIYLCFFYQVTTGQNVQTEHENNYVLVHCTVLYFQLKVFTIVHTTTLQLHSVHNITYISFSVILLYVVLTPGLMEAMTRQCLLPEVDGGCRSLSDRPPVGAHITTKLSLHSGVVNTVVSSE